ncbi:helix-turn-helix domain-containing protein [Clostridium butyricum]|uniref:helix-turn-helix domain-containing protein n=1 Tax=Clostridium butyricum TaxID=1492 RepID=UPI0005EB6137|nr:helix-turn-helix transcriptional regulator [Clostridium butyricum]
MGLEIINIIKKEKGMTSKQLSEKSKVPIGTLNKILNGQTKNPAYETIFALAKALDCSVDMFCDKKDTHIDIPTLSKEETTLLENYNKLNALGKKEAHKRVAELTEINRYLNTTTDEITATTDNVVELNNKKITYDDFETVAAHNDNLTDDEISEADRRILADINKRNSK